MLKAIGKWAVKKAAGLMAGQLVRMSGGGPAAQEIASVAAEMSVGKALEN